MFGVYSRLNVNIAGLIVTSNVPARVAIGDDVSLSCIWDTPLASAKEIRWQHRPQQADQATTFWIAAGNSTIEQEGFKFIEENGINYKDSVTAFVGSSNFLTQHTVVIQNISEEFEGEYSCLIVIPPDSQHQNQYAADFKAMDVVGKYCIKILHLIACYL